MDRRIQKTRDSIFTAFSRLLSMKKYSQITVQDIIDEANIGRSTFYAHFETKDQLLDELCRDIFDHIFAKDLSSEQHHDFSGNKDFEAKITHILYHLKESKHDMKSILTYESADIFWSYFKRYFEKLFADFIDSERYHNVPEEFLLNHMAGSFVELVKWWMKKDMKPEPEVVASYFIEVIKK
ncbi:transcriptional regulator, TetR family [Lachnoclostridium phytofermentans ISDg]|uniref:Transcriptional regulator, TetR family n=2 Tax=Lachnoclostridium phytofermentans TaxID=66219 RepID=A9KP80_LACP7|nr:transcriptional regulator, TetR family [Lachnoclostridium phytofermentans ISDg]